MAKQRAAVEVCGGGRQVALCANCLPTMPCCAWQNAAAISEPRWKLRHSHSAQDNSCQTQWTMSCCPSHRWISGMFWAFACDPEVPSRLHFWMATPHPSIGVKCKGKIEQSLSHRQRERSWCLIVTFAEVQSNTIAMLDGLVPSFLSDWVQTIFIFSCG